MSTYGKGTSSPAYNTGFSRLPYANSSDQKKMVKVCRCYLSGHCAFGDKCTYLHTDPLVSKQPLSTPHQQFSRGRHQSSFHSSNWQSIQSPTARQTDVCRFFLLGYCRYGTGCNFLHPRGVTSKPTTVISPEFKWDRRQVHVAGSYSQNQHNQSQPPNRFHFRKSNYDDDDAVVNSSVDENERKTTTNSEFSFRQTLQNMHDCASPSHTQQEPSTLADFGYAADEVYSSVEDLESSADASIYAEEEEFFAPGCIPLMAPCLQHCSIIPTCR